jgi:cell wall-associated NlpC family hydrolase
LANNKDRRVNRIPGAVTAVIAVGAASAASVGVGVPPGAAEPNYPSWNDVQNAKNNLEAKQAQIDSIVQLVGGLQSAADSVAIHSAKKAEAFRKAHHAHDEAVKRADSLHQQADSAAAKAKVSRMRAGLLAAHLAKNGGADLSVSLFINGEDAKTLLNQLGTAAKLTENSKKIYADAVADENSSNSLAGQSRVARDEREKRAGEAESALTEANGAMRSAQDAVVTQQAKSAELVAQLAALKDSTIDAEMAFLAGQAATSQAAAETARGEQRPSPGDGGVTNAVPPAASSNQERPTDSGSSDRTGDGGPSGGDSPRSTVSESAPPTSSVAAPDRSAVETAIDFASAQIGKPYALTGMGPDSWDCSGLTKRAYAAAGIYIGTHSATNQYNTMANQGKLVPFSQRERGDLIFWGDGDGQYHVAIYVGGGQIIEAPDVGRSVHVGRIWGMSEVESYVGRPSS